jgi:ppGpp synthetase/RelA/SpoT-type nucleotidyltranferase
VTGLAVNKAKKSMADWKWTEPDFSRQQVNNAGEILIKPDASLLELEDALAIINNWRSSHSCPLQSIKMTLLARAKKIERAALIAQRIKRLRAIKVKLSRPENDKMMLSRMHDIGGCRAIMRTVSQVEELLKVYEIQTGKNRLRGGEAVKTYDYIKNPKPDGYRGVHLVRKYHSESPRSRHKVFDGLRVEIQIRSRLQHAWATAVEAVDYFTGQALKSNLGEDSWKRFFALASSAFAQLENRPLVPGTPVNPDELKLELKRFSAEMALVEGLNFATEITQDTDGHFFLLELDLEHKTIRTTSFNKEKLLEAQDAYVEVEKRIKDNPKWQAVLVSVDSLSELRKAYPNFFLDISDFVSALEKILTGRQREQQLRLPLAKK